MKRILNVFVLIPLVLVMVTARTAGAVHPGEAEVKAPEKHYEDSLMAVSENEEFSVEVILPDKGVEMGINKVDLIIHDSGGEDVPGARVTVTPWMPEMDHGVSEVPKVMERGGGLYTVHNVMFSMTGKWELRFDIIKGEKRDTAIVDLPPVGAMGHMHTMPAPDMSTIDTASKKETREGRFVVSYVTEGDSIPVNNLLTWTLEVRTPDGQPVAGADIRVVGDMPEHGHGFPTIPEVTEELGEGRYLVEGIKFSMPGWWVVTFHIRAGDQDDAVSFNLVPR
ncbi:MAG: FixH family protein [bacterium]|nr:MAG: FixH family protein [bacterium]